MTVIAIDFDGTIVEHMYPEIGPDVPQAFDWMKDLQAGGARLILWTMRDGEKLEEAVQHCRERGIEFWGINENPDQAETKWSGSPKAFAHMYIDDLAAGCPRISGSVSKYEMVDWSIAGPLASMKVRGRS